MVCSAEGLETYGLAAELESHAKIYLKNSLVDRIG